MPAYVFFYLFTLVEMSDKQANKPVFPLCASGPQRLFRGLTKFGGLGYNIVEPEKKKTTFLSAQKRTEGKKQCKDNQAPYRMDTLDVYPRAYEAELRI